MKNIYVYDKKAGTTILSSERDWLRAWGAINLLHDNVGVGRRRIHRAWKRLLMTDEGNLEESGFIAKVYV